MNPTQMNWRGTQAESRRRHLAQYTDREVDRYEGWVLQMEARDDQACLQDLQPEVEFRPGMKILDAGAGTGAMCKVLQAIPGVSITALEPCEPMRAKLMAKPELAGVDVVEGFCDSIDDRSLFESDSFDVIVSRQLVNGLFDPRMAFANWFDWLRPGGQIVVMDGLYDRDAWAGPLQSEVDTLPLSACRTTAMVPYLLESIGFEIVAVRPMAATNALPMTRTERYVVIARMAEPPVAPSDQDIR